MLTSLNKFAKSWVAGIFILLLVLSFAVWGIEDMFRPGQETVVAKVGEHEVDAYAFERELRMRIDGIQRQMGVGFTLADARAAGLDGAVLNEMINRAALDGAAVRLGATASDTEIATRIKTAPSFIDSFGSFDRFRFDQALYQMGMDENDFAAGMRGDIARQQLVDAAVNGARPAPGLAEAVFARRNETRDVSFFVIDESAIDPVGEPADEAVKVYHEGNANAFSAPEYRKLTLVEIALEQIAEGVIVPDNEIRAAYEARIAEFSRAETRVVDQLLLQDKAAADAVAANLREGVTFEAEAEAAGFQPSDYALGVITRDQLPDETAEAAFAAAAPGIIGPVETAFGFAVLRVGEITPAAVKPFEEVRETVRNDLALDRAHDEVYDVSARFEDERAGGASIEEAARALQLPVRTIEAIDARGLDAAGARIGDLPAGDFLRIAFAAEQRVDAELQETPDGGYFIVRVDSVTPPSLRPLETVREQVISLWKLEETRRRIRERTDKLMETAKTGGLEVAAKELGVEVATREDVAAETVDPQLSTELLTRLFDVGVGVPVEDVLTQGAGEGRVIAVTTEITRPDPASDRDGFEAVSEQLSQGFASDIASAMVSELRAEAGVQINPTVMEYVLGTRQ